MNDRASLDQVVAAHLAASRPADAYQHILTVLGPGLRGYLRAAARSDLHGDEIYDELRLRLWEALPSFTRWLGQPAPVEALTGDASNDSESAEVSDRRAASSVRAWVYRSARNRLIDWTRRASRNNAPLLDEAAVPGLAPRLSTLIHDRQRQALVARALGDLTDAERDALVLRAERGMSFREVAEVLGISIPAAKERYHRAKERLRRLLSESV